MAGPGFNPSGSVVQGAISSAENLGLTIAGKLYDAESSVQYSAAMNTATLGLNDLYNQLQSNQDTESYPDLMQKAEQQIQDKISPLLKNPDAKNRFGQAWESLKTQNVIKVENLAMSVRGNKAIGLAQTNADSFLDQVKAGTLTPDNALDLIKHDYGKLVDTGMVTPEQAETVYRNYGAKIAYFGFEKQAFDYYNSTGDMNVVDNFISDPNNIPDGVDSNQVIEIHNKVLNYANWGKKDASDATKANYQAIQDSIQNEIETRTNDAGRPVSYQTIFNHIYNTPLPPNIRKSLFDNLNKHANDELDNSLSKAFNEVTTGNGNLEDLRSQVNTAVWVGDGATQSKYREMWRDKFNAASAEHDRIVSRGETPKGNSNIESDLTIKIHNDGRPLVKSQADMYYKQLDAALKLNITNPGQGITVSQYNGLTTYLDTKTNVAEDKTDVARSDQYKTLTTAFSDQDKQIYDTHYAAFLNWRYGDEGKRSDQTTIKKQFDSYMKSGADDVAKKAVDNIYTITEPQRPSDQTKNFAQYILDIGGGPQFESQIANGDPLAQKAASGAIADFVRKFPDVNAQQVPMGKTTKVQGNDVIMMLQDNATQRPYVLTIDRNNNLRWLEATRTSSGNLEWEVR